MVVSALSIIPFHPVYVYNCVTPKFERNSKFHIIDFNRRLILKCRMNLIFFTHRFQSKIALVYLWSEKGSIASTWLGIPLGKQLDKSSQNLCKFTRLCFKSPLMPVRKRWLAQLALFKFHRTLSCFESIVAIKRLYLRKMDSKLFFKFLIFIGLYYSENKLRFLTVNNTSRTIQKIKNVFSVRSYLE